MDFDYLKLFDFSSFTDVTHGQNEVRVAHSPVAWTRALSYPLSLQIPDYSFNTQEPNMDQLDFDFAIPQWYTPKDISPLVQPPPQILFDTSLQFLTPPIATLEQYATPTLPYLLSPELSLVGLSGDQIPPVLPSPELPVEAPSVTSPPVAPRPSPLPTPQVPVQQPTPKEINNFHFCPFTENGIVCGHVNWKTSSNKGIERHLKQVHFQPGFDAKAWRCPNHRCRRMGRPFKRKDALRCHRTNVCNPMHLRKDPNFIPLPNIEEGDDVEVKRWIKAGKALRDSIKKKLRDGTPWGFDLLEPIHL